MNGKSCYELWSKIFRNGQVMAAWDILPPHVKEKWDTYSKESAPPKKAKAVKDE